MQWIASAAFGLEGQTAKDLKRLGIENVSVMPVGGVMFEADEAQAFSANMHLRCADRVMLVVGRFEAKSFDALFEQVRSLPWEDYIDRDGAFPVRAHCARSTLMSPSDCQSIVKKAVVERLKGRYGIEWFDESGSLYQIDVSLHGDVATVCLDASGQALNKRGYRLYNGEAPIRETLAAGLALASPWRSREPFWDPCCGTGTLVIEAAYIALNRAPGLTRQFDCEKWRFMPAARLKEVRAQAMEAYLSAAARNVEITGSDIDGEALSLARRHVRLAGLEGKVLLLQRDLKDIPPQPGVGAFVCNPPYGDRMGDRKSAAAIERELLRLKERCAGWSLSAISADMSFERNAGRKADRKRRFYNGRLECDFLTFLAQNQP